MSGSLNKVTLIGNLGRDPEIRVTQEGGKIAVISVATSEQWKDRTTEERKERTEWHKVVIFNPYLVEVCEKFLKKGQKVFVEGSLHGRKWVDQNNQEHRAHEVRIRYKGDIIILDSKDQRPQSSSSSSYGEETPLAQPQEAVDSLLDDEIPF